MFQDSPGSSDPAFNIRRIELMQHVSRLARLIGSGIQYSTEHTERCHIPMAKKPYRSSNKKDHPEQVCRHLDRHDKIHRFTEYQEWVSLELDVAPPSGAALIPAATAHREKNLALFTKNFLPESVRNAFDDDECPHNSTTAFILTSKATALNCSIDDVATAFKIPSFRTTLRQFFIKRRARGSPTVHFIGLVGFTNTELVRICYFVGGRNQLQWLCHVTRHIFKISSHGFKTL